MDKVNDLGIRPSDSSMDSQNEFMARALKKYPMT